MKKIEVKEDRWDRYTMLLKSDFKAMLAVCKAADKYFNTNWLDREGGEAAENKLRAAIDKLNARGRK